MRGEPRRRGDEAVLGTAGFVDVDAELCLWLRGQAEPLKQEFRRGDDVHGVHRVPAKHVLKQPHHWLRAAAELAAAHPGTGSGQRPRPSRRAPGSEGDARGDQGDEPTPSDLAADEAAKGGGVGP